VVEARVWQDPQGVLRDELLKLPGARRPKGGENRSVGEMVEEAAIDEDEKWSASY
jgi:hypothetical protein